MAVGYKLGMDDGYGWQATSSIGFHVEPATDRFPTYVHRTGNYTIDGYTFVVATDSHPELAGDRVGYAPVGDPIYIETGRSLTDVYETCVHEKLHRTHPSAPHNWIYDVEDRVVDEMCLNYFINSIRAFWLRRLGNACHKSMMLAMRLDI